MPTTDQNENATPPIIWDLPLRLFHWTMVASVSVAAITGYFLPDWWLNVHAYAGYVLGALLIFRVIWGVVGSKYSRFKIFPLKTGQAKSHLANLLRGRSDPYTGHNPIGAWMIVLLLASLAALVVTGLVVWGGQENNGPLSAVVGYRLGSFTEEIHEFFAGFVMTLIGIHLVGVLVETAIFKHRIVPAMINGRKPAIQAENPVTVWHNLFGGLVFASVIAGIVYLAATVGVSQAKTIQLPEVYRQECGDCHSVYHPSLRTAQSWQAVMNRLSDHYGEDASLAEQKAAQITVFLKDNDADHFDTEAAHKIGRAASPDDRMTETRFWRKKHDDFKPEAFKHKAVGSKVNCNACHKDAETGRFDDARIEIPKGVKS